MLKQVPPYLDFRRPGKVFVMPVLKIVFNQIYMLSTFNKVVIIIINIIIIINVKKVGYE